jgi:iron complex transport system ATP-binding protein
MTALAISHLTVRYGTLVALNDVSLPPATSGTIVGILGPNGSGKSTLLRTLADGAPQEGRVEVEAAGDRRPFVYTPQSLPQPTSLLAYELLIAHAEALAPLAGKRRIEARVEEVFERIGIADLAMRPMRELSGGKRQLIGFALAVLSGPAILLLDEPTSALDIRWQLTLLQHVRNYVTENDAICLVALHDIGLAARACDTLALLHEGRLVASGEPEQVLSEINLAEVYGVRSNVYRRADGSTGIDILGPLDASVGGA